MIINHFYMLVMLIRAASWKWGETLTNLRCVCPSLSLSPCLNILYLSHSFSAPGSLIYSLFFMPFPWYVIQYSARLSFLFHFRIFFLSCSILCWWWWGGGMFTPNVFWLILFFCISIKYLYFCKYFHLRMKK